MYACINIVCLPVKTKIKDTSSQLKIQQLQTQNDTNMHSCNNIKYIFLCVRLLQMSFISVFKLLYYQNNSGKHLYCKKKKY